MRLTMPSLPHQLTRHEPSRAVRRVKGLTPLPVHVQSRAGGVGLPKLLLDWRFAHDGPDATFAYCDKRLTLDGTFRHTIGKHSQGIRPPESVNPT